MIAPPWHRHVSEREADGSWEDCLPTSAVMHARAARDRSIPATHDEAEALRRASGAPMTGGMTVGQIVIGLRNRYGWDGGAPVTTAEVPTRLLPGWSAIVNGRLANFPSGHRLRRWQPGFAGWHSVWVGRLLDGTFWWDDPLAPPTGYAGEPITEAELRTYTTGWTSCHLVARMLWEGRTVFPVVTRIPYSQPVAWRVSAGVTLNGYDPARPGQVVKSMRFDKPSMAHATADVSVRWVGIEYAAAPVPKGGPFLEVADGAFAGLLVVKGLVVVDPIPDPTKLARAKALEEARSVAIDAVGRAIDAVPR